MKAVIDFSYAAIAAAVIGIAVGGTVFSFVWLLHILKVWGRRRRPRAGGWRLAWSSSSPHDAEPATTPLW